jgi:hypothetical protein
LKSRKLFLCDFAFGILEKELAQKQDCEEAFNVAYQVTIIGAGFSLAILDTGDLSGSFTGQSWR